ncbi:hypothetical protein [Nonomuraea sp. B19D2]|uniref:hypothetical protein n=1 Tax=Nonomuraea sp. B19D2 TaxID=3159561 RepID=UPI0032D9DB5A
MPKEYAALLAQVIPVLALAVGLELRSLTARYVLTGHELLSTLEESDRIPRIMTQRMAETQGQLMLGITILFLSLTQVVFAVAELKSLETVAGAATPLRNGVGIALIVGICAAFTLPALESLTRVIFTTKPNWKTPGRRVACITTTMAVLFTGIAVLHLLWDV